MLAMIGGAEVYEIDGLEVLDAIAVATALSHAMMTQDSTLDATQRARPDVLRI